MSRASFGNMANMNSSYSIGHSANFSDESSGGGSNMSAFGNMFENNENLVQFINSITTKSNTISILLPTIDQIFQTTQGSTFGLEGLGILNYLDPSKAISNISSLPKPLSPVSNQKGQSR
jgi:hypothetical protein